MKTIEISREIIDNVFINMPLRQIDDKYWELIEANRFNLEIGIDHYSLDNFSRSYYKDIACRLNNLGIRMTVHAPFHEMFLGSSDRLIREASVKRMDSAFEVIDFFSPASVVMHLNYEQKRFGFLYEEWFSAIIPNLKGYADKCKKMDAILLLENVYEETPDVIVTVLENMDEYPVCHCIDAGHVNAFSDIDLKEWIKKTGGYIRQFHLHDNDGFSDSHDAIGMGNINFNLIVDYISRMEQPPIITLEPHTEENLWKTLKGIERIGLVEALKR